MGSLRSTLASLAAISTLTCSLPVSAQSRSNEQSIPNTPGQYDGAWTGGWVGADGQIYRGDWRGTYTGPDGRSYQGSYSGQWNSNTQPHNQETAHRGEITTQRDIWLLDCQRRLDIANRARDGVASYRAVCDAWLGYYERRGMTRDGYGFTYAIPVTLVALAPKPVACCMMQTAPKPHYMPIKRKHRADKRIKLFRD